MDVCGLFFFLSFLALQWQLIAQVCAVSFKVFVGELYFGEIRYRKSSVVVMLFFQCISELSKINVFGLGEKNKFKRGKKIERDKSTGWQYITQGRLVR